MAMQFHVMNNQPLRTNFITRRQSYHGATLGALGLSGHPARREYFEGRLNGASHISPYYPYRGLKENESDAQYIQRLADELEAQFQKLGPETVAAVVLEPVVGAVSTENLVDQIFERSRKKGRLCLAPWLYNYIPLA